jgi:hypothetical protein
MIPQSKSAIMERDPRNQRDPDPLPEWTKDNRRTDMFAARRMWYVILALLVIMAIAAGLINYWSDDQPMTSPAPQEQTVPRSPGE